MKNRKRKIPKRLLRGNLRLCNTIAQHASFEMWTGRKWFIIPREWAENTEVNKCLKLMVDVVLLDNCGDRKIIPAVTEEIINSLKRLTGKKEVPISMVAPKVMEGQIKPLEFKMPKLADGVDPNSIQSFRLTVPVGYIPKVVGDTVNVTILEGLPPVEFSVVTEVLMADGNVELGLKRVGAKPDWVGGK